jgi:hypothetical protein
VCYSRPKSMKVVSHTAPEHGRMHTSAVSAIRYRFKPHGELVDLCGRGPGHYRLPCWHRAHHKTGRRSQEPTHTNQRLRMHVSATFCPTTDLSINNAGLPEKMAFSIAQERYQS